MDVIEFLERDHRSIEDLFQRWEGGMEAGAERLALLHQIVEEVSAHRGVEERVLFPAIAEELPGGQNLVDEHAVEHARTEKPAAHLVAATELAPRVERAADELIDRMRHHARDEEERLVPQLRSHLEPTRLEELGADAVRARPASGQQ